jgi:hypothetical protein
MACLCDKYEFAFEKLDTAIRESPHLELCGTCMASWLTLIRSLDADACPIFTMQFNLTTLKMTRARRYPIYNLRLYAWLPVMTVRNHRIVFSDYSV